MSVNYKTRSIDKFRLPSKWRYTPASGWEQWESYEGPAATIEGLYAAYIANGWELDVEEVGEGNKRLVAYYHNRVYISWEMFGQMASLPLCYSSYGLLVGEKRNRYIKRVADRYLGLAAQELTDTDADSVIADGRALLKNDTEKTVYDRYCDFVDSFEGSEGGFRKRILISPATNSELEEIASGIKSNDGKIFTTAQILAVETTIPAAYSALMGGSDKWLKQNPNVLYESTGSLNATVEYKYMRVVRTGLYNNAS